jgi:hypothetical protein
MQVITSWTGGHAYALQRSLRMTNQSFAEHLDMSVRSVAGWHQKPDTVLAQATQDILDKALDRAPERAKAQFSVLIGGEGGAGPGPLRTGEPAHEPVLSSASEDAGCLAEGPGWLPDVDRSVSLLDGLAEAPMATRESGSSTAIS